MNIPVNYSKIESLATLDTQQQFDAQNCWYPITFVRDFPSNRPYGFTLYDEPFVLFRERAGKLACLQDVTAHRNRAVLLRMG